MTQSPALIRLATNQIDQAAQVLARAFQNDPMMQYLVPGDTRRARLLPSLFVTVVRYCLRYGEVYTTPTPLAMSAPLRSAPTYAPITPTVNGVACWLPPGNTSPTIGRILRVGIHVSPLDFGWAALRRYIAAAAYTDTVHQQCAPGQHWYLWALGVDPPHQGQGVGGMLIQPVLAQADATGLPCYLETENPKNVSFYQKHGFTVASEGEVPKRRLRVWGMVRQPRR